MKNVRVLLWLTLVPLMTFIGCKKDPHGDEGELITTVYYNLTPVDGGTTISLIFRDLDGDGGNPPEIVGGTLAANTIYNGVIELWDETQTPADDIAKEVKEEGDEHQFFFSSTLQGVAFAYRDVDKNGNPIGLLNTLTTSTVGNGTVTLTLQHSPRKTANGVREGNIANAGGHTDVQVTFPINVE
jgi:hypothetical protein